MIARETRRADDLVPGVYIYEDGVMHLLVFRLPFEHDQLLLLATGQTITHRNDVQVELATAEEIFEAAAVAQASGRGLRNFPGLSPTIGPVRDVFGPMYAERCSALPWTYLGSPCTEHLDGLHQCAELDTHPRHRCVCGAEYGEKPKPAPVGWPLGDGHRPTPPADAMTQDRFDGEG